MADEETVRCRKCRKIFLTDLDCLLNNHGQKHQGGRADNDEGSTHCTAASERSCLYVSEDSYPQFITDALDESSWTKGKLNCPGCQARIGSFNYISGSKCECGSHIVPQVHLLVSKVDVRRAREMLPNPVSYPDRPVALSAADIESLPILICADSSTEFSSASSLPVEAHQPCNEEQMEATNNLDDTHHSYSTESNALAEPSSSGTLSESSPKKHLTEARRRHRCKQLTDADTELDIAKTSSTSSNFHVLASSEEDLQSEDERNRRSDDIPLHLTCAVCLDLLYSPFVAQPCSHVFCEPCLRRLAKPNPTKTYCPLCRQIIGQCMPCKDLSAEVREKFPSMYQERHLFEQKNNIQHIPLPWLRNFRMDRFPPHGGSFIQMAGGWRPILWTLMVNVLGFGSLALLRWYLKSQRLVHDGDNFEEKERENIQIEETDFEETDFV